MKKAIVTLAIGKKYESLFEEYCRVNWQQYCNNFGYELIVITDALDSSGRAKQRSPAWQKLLILSQNWSLDYEQIVWIDTDVIINNEYASDISKDVPVDMVGAVETYSIPSRDIHDIVLERMYQKWDNENIPYLDNRKPHMFYTNRGLPGNNLNEVAHTGVLVCSPKYHREIFEYIYYSYDDINGSEWNYEMPAMSFELVKASLVHWISPKFNFCVPYLMAAFYPESFFKYVKKDCNNQDLISKVYKKIKKSNHNNYSSELELLCLKNIYSLSVFMHFAGSLELLIKYNKLISE